MTLFNPYHENQLAGIRKTDRQALIGNLILYCFRGTQQADLREFIESRDLNFDFLGWRLHLHRNGTLLRNGKVYLYRRFCGKTDQFAAYGLTERDAAWVKSSLKWTPLASRLEALQAEGRTDMDLKALDGFATSVLASEDFETYVSKYISKKMGFLMKSYNITKDEIRADLYSWSYYALLKAYPRFDDVGHGIAIAKTTAKNRGVNLIKSKTADSRNALNTDDGGNCSASSLSLSSFMDDTGQFLSEDGSYYHRSLLVVDLNGKSRSGGEMSWEDSTSLNQLLNSSKFSSRQRLFLKLAAGAPDPDFTAWLGEPNEVYADRVLFEELKLRICKFMDLSPAKASLFLFNLKKHL